MLALNKTNGKVAWKWSPSDIGGYQDSYATPTLVRSGDRNDLVLAVSREIWAFDPEERHQLVCLYKRGGSNVSPSVIASSNALYAFGGYPRQSELALKIGGKGKISESHKLWTTFPLRTLPIVL